MNTLLKQLAAIATPRHPWADARDLITNGYVEDADAGGFTVLTSTGNERFDVPGGMTVEAYETLAPLCSDDEKGLLAGGVVQNLLTVDWHTWDRIQCFFFEARKEGIEEWLPGAVKNGFDPVLAEIKNAIAQLPPLPPPKPTLREMPNGVLLRYGSEEWRITSRASTIIPILMALHKNEWKSVSSIEYRGGILDDMQVKQALNQLKERTKKVIDWHAQTTTYPFGTPIPNGLDKKRGPTKKNGKTKITGVWWESLI